MNDESTLYISLRWNVRRPERIDSLLEKRMKEFVLARRRKLWQEKGL